MGHHTGESLRRGAPLVRNVSDIKGYSTPIVPGVGKKAKGKGEAYLDFEFVGKVEGVRSVDGSGEYAPVAVHVESENDVNPQAVRDQPAVAKRSQQRVAAEEKGREGGGGEEEGSIRGRIRGGEGEGSIAGRRAHVMIV